MLSRRKPGKLCEDFYQQRYQKLRSILSRLLVRAAIDFAFLSTLEIKRDQSATPHTAEIKWYHVRVIIIAFTVAGPVSEYQPVTDG